MMILSPETVTQPAPSYPVANVSIYKNGIRFSRLAAHIMKLPRPVIFHCEGKKMMLVPDEKGFEVKISGSWKDFVIYNRALTKKILDHFNATTLNFEVISRTTGSDIGEYFELKLFKQL